MTPTVAQTAAGPITPITPTQTESGELFVNKAKLIKTGLIALGVLLGVAVVIFVVTMFKRRTVTSNPEKRTRSRITVSPTPKKPVEEENNEDQDEQEEEGEEEVEEDLVVDDPQDKKKQPQIEPESEDEDEPRLPGDVESEDETDEEPTTEEMETTAEELSKKSDK
jgi:hypothetical protein